jgi:hypothetical protein
MIATTHFVGSIYGPPGSGAFSIDTMTAAGSSQTAVVPSVAGVNVSNPDWQCTSCTTSTGTAPSVTTNPISQTVTAGHGVSFTAAASGSPAPTVRWQLSINGGVSFQDITGATQTTYTIASTTSSENGYRFRAVFTNTLGSATTTAAMLTVTSTGGGGNIQALAQATDKAMLSAVDAKLAHMTVRKLLNAGCVTASFTATVLGKGSEQLIGNVNAKSQISKVHKPKTAVVLSGAVTVAKTGKASIRVCLTSSARKFLGANRKKHQGAHLTNKAKFTPLNGTTVTNTGRVKLKP